MANLKTKEALDNQSKINDPEDPLYWRARQMKGRPKDWKKRILDAKQKKKQK